MKGQTSSCAAIETTFRLVQTQSRFTIPCTRILRVDFRHGRIQVLSSCTLLLSLGLELELVLESSGISICVPLTVSVSCNTCDCAHRGSASLMLVSTQTGMHTGGTDALNASPATCAGYCVSGSSIPGAYRMEWTHL